jgi:hypothetical protein
VLLLLPRAFLMMKLPRSHVQPAGWATQDRWVWVNVDHIRSIEDAGVDDDGAALTEIHYVGGGTVVVRCKADVLAEQIASWEDERARTEVRHGR